MKKLEGFQHGINLGGWLSQCVHTREHYDSFIGEEDIRRIASWGLDHVRVPVDYELIETPEGDPIEKGYAYLETCIQWCRKYGLHMILDLHKTAGYNFGDQQSSVGFFENEPMKERFRQLWVRLARRFSKDKDLILFELLNEVVDPQVYESWNQLAEETIGAIRKIDKEVPIMYGGIAYNSVRAVPLLRKMPYPNLVYNFHCYEPLIFTHQGAPFTKGMPVDFRTPYPQPVPAYLEKTREYLDPMMLENLKEVADRKEVCGKDFFLALFRQAVEKAEADGVALYCGEYGVIDRADPRSTVNWYRDIHAAFDACGIGSAAWSYRKMDFGLVDEHYDSVRDELIALL